MTQTPYNWNDALRDIISENRRRKIVKGAAIVYSAAIVIRKIVQVALGMGFFFERADLVIVFLIIILICLSDTQPGIGRQEIKRPILPKSSCK